MRHSYEYTHLHTHTQSCKYTHIVGGVAAVQQTDSQTNASVVSVIIRLGFSIRVGMIAMYIVVIIIVVNGYYSI